MALELKRSKAAPATKLQLYNIARINESGGLAYLVYPENLDETMAELEDISNVEP